MLWTYFDGTPWDHANNYIRHSSRNGLAQNAQTPSLLLRGENDCDHGCAKAVDDQLTFNQLVAGEPKPPPSAR